MLNPHSHKSLPETSIIVVQGCARTNCDCEVHFRDRNFNRKFAEHDGKMAPTEFPKVYFGVDRGHAVRDYRRRHPKAVKVIAATV